MPITGQYSPDVFMLVPMSELSKQHFDRHPIWSEHYDVEEREEIIDWGVDADWLAEALDRMHTGNDHCAYPILRPYPLPDRMRLYIKARLRTAEDVELDGHVMNEDASVLSVFVDNDEYVFSSQPVLWDLHTKELDRLRAAIGSRSAMIFPIDYDTDFLDVEGNLIAGSFTLHTAGT